MKKVMLGLVMVMMLMSLVGCGETKKEGFVPEQVTESEVVTDEVKEEIEEVIDTANLQKYYDVEKYLGTPRLTKMQSSVGSKEIILSERDENLKELFSCTISMVGEKSDWIRADGMGWKEVDCIVCDNNTPNDYSDDVIAYIFMD